MHIYKKVLPAAVALALAACGGGSDTVPDQSEGATQIGTFPRFDPLASDLPLNTDLIFAAAATSDGTANVGTPTNAVEAAINDLDGFSTTAYFDIGFAGGSIDAGTVCALGSPCVPNVFLIPLNSNGDALDPANIDLMSPVNSADIPGFTASVESLDGGTDNVLRVTPSEPLLAKTKYLVFVTNGTLDTNGSPITPSSAYQTLGENEPALTAALQPVRTAVQGWEAIASGFLANVLGLDPLDARDSVVISYTFTTTDPVTPLVAMGAPRGAIAQTLINGGSAPGDAVAAATNLENNQLLSTLLA